jgi:two-component system, OmpR family, response regulator CpxR
MERLLLVDDDAELSSLLQRFLAGEGFLVEAAQSGADGIRKAASGGYALILLDVMMPRVDGFEVLREVRSKLATPVLMLTAKGDTRDRVLGLELGADDYLPKPFDPAELAARIRAILRRAKPVAARFSAGGLDLDARTRTLLDRGKPVELTTVEFDLLLALMRDAGSTISRERLCREVLGREFSPFDRSVDTHVYNLRKKIGSGRIKGVRGAGYLYAAEAG